MAGMQRTATIVIGFVVLVVLGVVAFVLLAGGRDATPSPSPSASASSVPSASAEPSFNAELLDRRWTVLYVGTDLNERRQGEGGEPNTDALMLVSLSADQSRLTLVSLPRDTVDVPLADGGTWDGKVNSIYLREGMDTLVGAVEATFGVAIDAPRPAGHGRLLSAGGRGRVDRGLAARSDRRSDRQPGPAAGDQELDGPQTLGYVRTRVDQDYGRMGRQQEVLVSLVTKFLDPATDVDLRAVLDSLDSLETDLPLDDLPTLLELARRASTAEVETLVIQPPLITFAGDRDDGRGYVLEADFDAIRDEVASLIGD